MKHITVNVVLLLCLLWADTVTLAESEPALVSQEKIHEAATRQVYDDGTVKLVIRGRPDKYNPVTLLPSPKPTNPEPKATATDKDRGYFIFVPESGDGVLPEYRPAANELTDEINMFASQGESEHASFCIRPLRDLGNVTIEVEQPIDARGRSMQGAVCEVYIVCPTLEQPHHNAPTCRWTTKWIELTDHGEALAGKNLQVVVDIHVPGGAAAGQYVVPVHIKPARGKASRVTINLKVLPIKLEPSMSWGFYLYGQHWQKIDQRKQQLLMKFEEMRRFGVTGGVISHNHHPMPGVSADAAVDLSAYDRSLALYRQAGFADPPILAMEGTMFSLVKAMGQAGSAVPFKGRNYPGIEADQVPENVRAFARKVFAAIHDHSRQANWPPHYIYLTDEPYGPLPAHTGEMQLAQISYPLARQAAPGMKLACSVYSVDWWQEHLDGMLDFDIAPYTSVCANDSTNQRWRNYAASQRARLHGIGWIGSIDNFWQGRHMTFIAEKGELDGITCWAQWVVSEVPAGYDLHPYERLRNEWKGGPFALRGADGHIWRSMCWLGVREGIDDSRYLRTARALIAKANASGSAHVRAQADAAKQRLTQIMRNVPWFDDIGEDRQSWTVAIMNGVRSDIADAAIELHQALQHNN